MSSDPTKPMRPQAQWPDQPPQQSEEPTFTPADPARTRVEPAFSPAAPAHTPVGAPAGQDAPPAGQAPPPGAGQDYPPAGQDYRSADDYGPRAAGQGGQARPPRRGRRRFRRSVVSVFTVLVLAIVLLIADRVGNAVAENEMASQFTANGFPVKPGVTIEGFPFLTQLAAKDFKKVDISASSVPAGPVTITSVKATITGMRISGYSSSASATLDHISATAFISFGALAGAGGLGDGTGITMVPDGPDKLKITASVAGVTADSEEARITQTGPRTISVKLLNSGSILSSLLSSFSDFSFSLPAGVPASLRITGFTLDQQGLTVSAAASHATFSAPGK